MSDHELTKIESNPIQGLSGFASSDGQRRMIQLANEFKAMSANRAKDGRKWIVSIGPSKHLTIEAWQYLGQRAGVIAKTTETEDLYNPVTGDYQGCQATAEAVRVETGECIGRAVQVCYADEVLKKRDGTCYARWMDEEGKPSRHAILGMAQTRAQSRCLASVLRFLAELAGAEGTPAEEMDQPPPRQTSDPQRRSQAKPRPEPQPPQEDLDFPDQHMPEGPQRPSNDALGECLDAAGILQTVTKRTYKGKIKYGLKINGTFYGTWDEGLGEHAETMINNQVVVWYKTNAKGYNDLEWVQLAEEE